MRIYNYTEKDLVDGLRLYIPYKDKQRNYWLEKRHNSSVSDYWICSFQENGAEHNDSKDGFAKDILFNLNNGIWRAVKFYKIW